MSPQDNEDDLNKTKERTSSLLSRLHCGLWKANLQDDKINAMDATFRDVTFACGKMLSGWKKALDMEILKEQGNYNIERQRIIVLIEGDHQLNAKRLGRLVMKMTDREELGLITDEQCGCRAHLRQWKCF